MNIRVEVLAVCKSSRPLQRLITFKSIEPFETAGIDGDNLERKKVHSKPGHTYYVNAAEEAQIQHGFVDLQVEVGGYYANMKYLGQSSLQPTSSIQSNAKLLVPNCPSISVASSSTNELPVNEADTIATVPLATLNSLTDENQQEECLKVEPSSSQIPVDARSSETSSLLARVAKLERQTKDQNDLLIEMAKLMVAHISRNAKMLHE